MTAKKMPISKIKAELNFYHNEDTSAEGTILTYSESKISLVTEDRFIMFKKLIEYKGYIIKKVGRIIKNSDSVSVFPILLKDPAGNIMNCSCIISVSDETAIKLGHQVRSIRLISRKHFIGENKIALSILATAAASTLFIVLNYFKQQ